MVAQLINWVTTATAMRGNTIHSQAESDRDAESGVVQKGTNCHGRQSLKPLPRLPLESGKETSTLLKFPRNVTPLMNEEQLWGCFYNFPELYEDVYSPTERVMRLRDVPELVGGVLTRDLVAACLTYLHRIPILEDYVYIKLDLTGKRLLNIDVLQHYKYLVYLDLTSNLLSNLSVLSNLLYLQFLSVDFNRLETVLEYSTPQWFLTEVHYKYNSVKKIRDLAMFWSITILDLSHNNIKSISGLQSLRYLRHLDLSFNHIQRLENLNHLRLLWLDVSYNNISSFELGSNEGLWTLLQLDYLNLNENNLKSLKIFSGCTRLREIHARNNRLGSMLELAVYMRQLRRLTVLDLRANPICEGPGYAHVICDTFPLLLSLDAKDLDPVLQRRFKMDTSPDVTTFASRRLLRMLYVEQLSRARVPLTPPADTEEVPLIVLVGEEAVGKGTLARRLAAEYDSKIKLGRQHTTAVFHTPDHYIVVSRQKFDDMLLAGEFLAYSEMDGESYGLSREEAFICDGKVRLCNMNLISALMLKLRGRRPYLILTTCRDKNALAARQILRKTVRNSEYEKRMSFEPIPQPSTLHVLLSGRIIINGILNEIIMSLPEEKYKSEFALDSECSLLVESNLRQGMRTFVRGPDMLTILTDSSSESSVYRKERMNSQEMDASLYSIYKRSQDSSAGTNLSCIEQKNDSRKKDSEQLKSTFGRRKTDADRTVTRSGSRQITAYDSTKSSKSVTFPDTFGAAPELIITEPDQKDKAKTDQEDKGISVSKCFADNSPPAGISSHTRGTLDNLEDADLWFAFLMETGLMNMSETGPSPSMRVPTRRLTLADNPESILHQLSCYTNMPMSNDSTTLRDEYEVIHRLIPGLFHDTIALDNPKEAFRKAKSIIKDIVNSQKGLGPMFDIDFANNLNYYPTVKDRLEEIRQEIAPRQIFH
ncbi:uncharacterized protein LOC125231347 [Leguminivora glycinivorella]|uniref:uncharacterized protein LOC125231347 n=1 Tax=Leguminivora glycinivorella TaxID=1035111 RepID=UPI00200EBD56|nr:uncharacterized protein LOC125231347 [Leguminivora glycinivorella]